jgi:hypothetical protein
MTLAFKKFKSHSRDRYLPNNSTNECVINDRGTFLNWLGEGVRREREKFKEISKESSAPIEI